ncbi:protein AAR2 homolog [Amphiura filiformis]|uniref:protein AAR2 homolog n=1 Tax=Amphiura filiformis TaxID=82378 RepID=UPI003B21D8DD
MDQKTAQTLFEEGATLIFLNVPEGTEFGIDYNTWTVGERFKGVKMIPPGVHFVYFSAVNIRDNQTAPRTGFFHNFKRKEILVKRWNKKDEDIAEERYTDPDEIARYRDTLRDLDRFLGPYPYDSLKKWVSLSNHLTESVLERLMPECGKILSATQLESDDATRTTEDRAKLAEARKSEQETSTAEQQLPRMHVISGTAIRFSAIPQNYPQGASPSEITKHSMDSSYALQSLLDSSYKDNPKDLLGELQFAFVCFLIGQVYDSFEQWKKLVHLLCTSEDAIHNHPEVYSLFITILHFQLREIPSDFFVDIVSSDNFLTSNLRLFFDNLKESQGVQVGLKEKGLKFKRSLTRHFKWNFNVVHNDEDDPMVVEVS